MASKKTSTEPVDLLEPIRDEMRAQMEDRREFRKYMNQVDYMVAMGAIRDEKLREVTEYLREITRAVTQY